MNSEENRLQRWARRKAEARKKRGAAALATTDESNEQPAEAPAHETAPAPEQMSEEPAVESELPDIESLTADSDFTAFMKEGVSPALRGLALRKLWAADPAFNVIDEMVEYGEDYTRTTMLAGSVKSAWKPERGYEADDEAPTAAKADTNPPAVTAEQQEDAEGTPAEEEASADADHTGDDDVGIDSTDETDRA
jgi:hypothetical protein